MEITRNDETIRIGSDLPVLPLRDVVLYPHITAPLLVGRPASVNAIEEAVADDRLLLAVAQKEPSVVEPGQEDLFGMGTVVRVLQMFSLPDGTIRVLVEGLARAEIDEMVSAGDYYEAKIRPLEEAGEKTQEIEALMRSVSDVFEKYVHLNRRISDEILLSVNNIQDPIIFSYNIAGHLQLRIASRQEILETRDLKERLSILGQTLNGELEILRLEHKIEGQVRTQFTKNQKEFYLNEQLKAIRKELGHQNEFAGEVEELERQIKKAGMPKEAKEKAVKELDRLSKMAYMSPEATVLRSYLDWLVGVPWKKRTGDTGDLVEVRKIMDEDHHGLNRVKDRILEHLAVVQLSGKIRGPILCLVGPPGVGKTSLGKSIARALGRKFVRMSLGGVRDEAEIRGHRRTYIGSMPGRIVQAMKRAGVVNPLILLDEVDKLGADYRGDPASALLEVLDPEQNVAFNDHYLEVDYDLSKVLFITTANYKPNIPAPLLDRMEIIDLPGYLETEKLAIARDFLVPKQIEANGLKPEDLSLSEDALKAITGEYTREAGVRNLEREIGKIARRTARLKAESKLPKSGLRVTPKTLAKHLGPAKFLESPLERKQRVGIANGLAWTESGGDLLTIEVTTVPGKGSLNLTGKLGDVMRESGVAAMTYARRNARELGLEKWFFQEADIHIHVPEGGIPKDGPSAGITMAVALVSALTGIPTKPEVAMTGEITLRGTVLPIGGLNEKLVAARRAGVSTVILPAPNAKDLAEVPPGVKRSLEFVFVEHMDEVLEHALSQSPREAAKSRGLDESGGAYAAH